MLYQITGAIPFHSCCSARQRVFFVAEKIEMLGAGLPGVKNMTLHRELIYAQLSNYKLV